MAFSDTSSVEPLVHGASSDQSPTRQDSNERRMNNTVVGEYPHTDDGSSDSGSHHLGIWYLRILYLFNNLIQ